MFSWRGIVLQKSPIFEALVFDKVLSMSKTTIVLSWDADLQSELMNNLLNTK